MSETQVLEVRRAPKATAAMLIRRPVAEVFEAFVDPALTSKFWFSHGSARLAQDAVVSWEWRMYDFSTTSRVLEFEPNQRISFAWHTGEAATMVEWTFAERPDRTTFVTVTNDEFSGDGDEQVSAAINATEGFTFVLAGAKAYLEHGIELNLVADRFPDGLG